MNFSLKHEYVSQKLNFLITELIFDEMKIVLNPYGSYDEILLNLWSFESLNNYVKSNKIYLLKNHIDFSNLFELSKMDLKNEGILIYGSASNFWSSQN